VSRYLVTIGTFDGVHRGHQALARWVISRARALGLKTRVVLFREPPRYYFKPSERLPLLSTAEERARRLKALGIDSVEILSFGSRWAKMPHERFFKEWILRRWKAGGLWVGRDFAFGKGRKGDLGYLQRACAESGVKLGVLPLLAAEGQKISSSRIRELLQNGKVADAGRLLGRPYSLFGKVVRGKGIGQGLGFPTANVDYPRELAAPLGVFRVRASGAGLGAVDAVANVGTRPTVDGSGRVLLEVHIPGWSGNLYGKILHVDFLERIRGERKFPSLDALKRQIGRDVGALSPVRK